MVAGIVVNKDSIQHVRRLLPMALVPSVVHRQVERVWADERLRDTSEKQMEFLLGRSARADEARSFARPWIEHMTARQYLRFHPRALTHQPVRDIEWLTTRRDPERGLLLSFAHHGAYDGLFGSLARLGPKIEAVMIPEMMAPDAPIAFRQHKAVVSKGAHLIPSTAGTGAMADVLRQKGILAIASDFPGRTEVTFLGRRVLGSFGAPRLATETDSPVVLVTNHRGEGGTTYLQVHEPLEPSSYSDPGALLADMLRIHGDAVLEWPEAVESPMGRFGQIDGA